MAASATPSPKPADPAPSSAAAALARLRLPVPLAVAFSGGADSTALLHAAAQRWPGQVRAVHVHHGLQAAADGFEAHCRRACDALGVPLDVVRVDARHARGESPEDAARRARYDALADAARDAGVAVVLLGQHADDQAETVMLALSRGAGLPGLAAMPERFEHRGVAFVRPLLGVPGRALRDWAASAGVAVVEDPTNADPQRTRNRIRHAVMPAIEAAFPAHREAFARTARHAAQAQELLADLAAQDLSAMGGEPGIAALRALPRARQANLLRHWLRVRHDAAPSAAQLDELLDQLADCATRGHGIQLKVADGVVERRADALVFEGPDRRPAQSPSV